MAVMDIDRKGGRTRWRPFGSTGLARRRSRLRTPLVYIGGAIVVAFLVLGTLGPIVAPYGPLEPDLVGRLEGPTASHWLGTDYLGRDMLSRLLFGARISLTIGVVVGTAALVVGGCLGVISGYRGGLLDNLVMRVMDVLLAFPGVLLAIGIVAALGPAVENVVIALSVNNIPVFARVARASTLTIKSRAFVEAGTSIGASDLRIMARHVVPNIVGPLMVLFSLRVGVAIVTASSLSFLGLGVLPPEPEWGAMLAEARDYLRTAPHMAIAPGMAVSTVVLGFSLLGDGLRDALDPHTLTRQRGL